jgi:phosphoglycolate phosphatase
MSQHDLAGWTVVFDLDGTLVDSAPDLIGVLNELLVARGHPPVPVSSSRHLVGHGARALLRHGFAEAGAVWDEAQEPELFDSFLKRYVSRIALESRPFEGVVETLEALARRSAVLCVATNKRTDLAEALLSALGLEHHFAAVVGADRVSRRKPDRAHLLETIAMASGDPRRAIMVGDASTDTGAARDAGLPCVVCSFGYNDLPPDRLGGDVRIDSFRDLVAAVTTLQASK